MGFQIKSKFGQAKPNLQAVLKYTRFWCHSEEASFADKASQRFNIPEFFLP